MSVPNVFQAPPPGSHSSRLTPVSTTRENQAPSESSKYPSLDQPNMDSKIGLMSSLFLYVFRSNSKGSQRCELRNSWNSGIPGNQEFLKNKKGPANCPSIAN